MNIVERAIPADIAKRLEEADTHPLLAKLTEKRNHSSWTPLVPIRQTAPTTRTPFVHPSTAQPPANPVVVRSVPRSIAYTKHDTPHSRERVFLQQPEIPKVAISTPEKLETVKQNSTPPSSSAPRTARTVASVEATPNILGQEWRPVIKHFVSPSNAHALITEKKEVWARTPINREESAPASGYTDHFRVFGATSSKDIGGIATHQEIT